MKIIGCIPARYQSSRFEGKPLAMILGKPMIIHVAEKVASALGHDATLVATDDQRIAETVTAHGFSVVMTSSACLTGTDRIYEVSQAVDADIYLNIQGDEPLVDPNDIRAVAQAKIDFPGFIVNGYAPLDDDEDPWDDTIPKVLLNKDEQLIYMSRYPLPGLKGAKEKPRYHKQICIYAFSKKDLDQFGSTREKAFCEFYEDIEILRCFDLGIPVKMIKCRSTIAVDFPEHIAKVERWLKLNQ